MQACNNVCGWRSVARQEQTSGIHLSGGEGVQGSRIRMAAVARCVPQYTESEQEWGDEGAVRREAFGREHGFQLLPLSQVYQVASKRSHSKQSNSRR